MISRATGPLCLLGAISFAACAPAEVLPPYPRPIRAVSFNVHGTDVISDPVTGPLIAGELEALAPDFAALQECGGCDALLANLPARYALVADPNSANPILYDRTAWEVGDTGVLLLGNDDGWGRREIRWAEFRSHEVPPPTASPVYVYSTHWCVTIRNPDDACDVEKHLEYAELVLDDIARRDGPAILGGDFNVFDGFEDGPVVELFVERGLVDTLRAVTRARVITYQGNNSFPPGRIDYLFATGPVAVTHAAVQIESISDHRPVSATVEFDRE